MYCDKKEVLVWRKLSARAGVTIPSLDSFPRLRNHPKLVAELPLTSCV